MALVPDLRLHRGLRGSDVSTPGKMFTLPLLSALLCSAGWRRGESSRVEGRRGVGGRGCALQVQVQTGRQEKNEENNAMQCNAVVHEGSPEAGEEGEEDRWDGIGWGKSTGHGVDKGGQGWASTGNRAWAKKWWKASEIKDPVWPWSCPGGVGLVLFLISVRGKRQASRWMLLVLLLGDGAYAEPSLVPGLAQWVIGADG